MSRFYKRKREKNFTQIDNNVVNNDNLSYKAKGILLYLMSKPDDWKVYLVDIINHGKEGRSAIESGIKELESERYIVKFQFKNEKGQFDTFFMYDEFPIAENDPDLQKLIKDLVPIKKDKTVAENQKRSNRSRKSATDYPQRKNRDGKSTSSNTKEQDFKNKDLKSNILKQQTNENYVVVVKDTILEKFETKVTTKVASGWLADLDVNAVVDLINTIHHDVVNGSTVIDKSVVGFIGHCIKNGYTPNRGSKRSVKQNIKVDKLPKWATTQSTEQPQTEAPRQNAKEREQYLEDLLSGL